MTGDAQPSILRLKAAAQSAVGVMSFVSRPEVWPSFAAWAEQNTPDTWDEADRRMLADDIQVMIKLADYLDGQAG